MSRLRHLHFICLVLCDIVKALGLLKSLHDPTRFVGSISLELVHPLALQCPMVLRHYGSFNGFPSTSVKQRLDLLVHGGVDVIESVTRLGKR